jgi:hypothetical protein
VLGLEFPSGERGKLHPGIWTTVAAITGRGHMSGELREESVGFQSALLCEERRMFLGVERARWRFQSALLCEERPGVKGDDLDKAWVSIRSCVRSDHHLLTDEQLADGFNPRSCVRSDDCRRSDQPTS